MSVPVGFTADRSTSGVTFQTPAGTQPVLRAVSALFDVNNASSVNLTWPAGTQAGDMVIIASHHGYNSNAPAGWNTLDRTTYNGNHGGAIFYKVMTAGDITAGGVTMTFGGGWWGGAVLIAYQDGASLSLGIVANANSTGSRAGGTMTLGYASDNNRSYILTGSGRDGDVTFNVATPDVTQSATNRYMALAELSPSTDTSINEAINWVSSGNGYYAILVSITKDAPAGGTTNVIATSPAIASATESTRWAVGNLYFEVDIQFLAGTPAVGICSYWFTPSAQTIGTTIDSIAYQSNGQVRINNATIATISAFAAGDTVCLAYHPGLQLIWFRVNNGSWNNDGTANPATAVGGISTATWRAERAFPAVGWSVGGTTFRARFADADWLYANPSGFESIEETVVTVAYTVEDPADAYADPSEFPDDIGEWNVKGDLGVDNFSRTVVFPAGPVKTIAGEVREDNVGVEGRLVRLYNRRTGELVGEFRTTSTGDFVIPSADPNLPHFVVAFDDDILPDYNAKIYDNVIPQ